LSERGQTRPRRETAIPNAADPRKEAARFPPER
jgi:hypothetical protein